MKKNLEFRTKIVHLLFFCCASLIAACFIFFFKTISFFLLFYLELRVSNDVARIKYTEKMSRFSRHWTIVAEVGRSVYRCIYIYNLWKNTLDKTNKKYFVRFSNNHLTSVSLVFSISASCSAIQFYFYSIVVVEPFKMPYSNRIRLMLMQLKEENEEKTTNNVQIHRKWKLNE